MSFYKEVFKRLSPYMKLKGFLHSKKSFYYIANDIAYCLGFDAPSGVMYVTVYIMPLYIPCDNKYYTYGNRIHNISNCNLQPLRKTDDKWQLDEWCKSLIYYIEDSIIPFFGGISSPSKLVQYVEKNPQRATSIIFCPEVNIARLKMFTYLYLCNQSQTIKAMVNYHDLLMKCNFITENVREKYVDEIKNTEALTQHKDHEILSYCNKIISETRKII